MHEIVFPTLTQRVFPSLSLRSLRFPSSPFFPSPYLPIPSPCLLFPIPCLPHTLFPSFRLPILPFLPYTPLIFFILLLASPLPSPPSLISLHLFSFHPLLSLTPPHTHTPTRRKLKPLIFMSRRCPAPKLNSNPLHLFFNFLAKGRYLLCFEARGEGSCLFFTLSALLLRTGTCYWKGLLYHHC